MNKNDWLSQMLKVITVKGQLDARCSYVAPWRVYCEESGGFEIPYHVVLEGRAVIQDKNKKTWNELKEGDVVLVPDGSAHLLHDGSDQDTGGVSQSQSSSGWMISENFGVGERLDMLCGRFFIDPPHEQLIKSYLPKNLIISSLDIADNIYSRSTRRYLSSLLALMRIESSEDRPGGRAVIGALTSALFAMVLRATTEIDTAPTGMLALASNPRLAPAISAMFNQPEHAWSLPELAALCNMSRATFMRHFHERLGKSANELLLDIRMSLAANRLRTLSGTTEEVADAVGYKSVAAFRRAFTEKMGVTPGQWRRQYLSENGKELIS